MDWIQKCFQLTWLTMKCFQEKSLKINIRKLEVNKERETIKETAFEMTNPSGWRFFLDKAKL